MPIYEYTCKTCCASFEKMHKTMAEAKAPACPECGSKKTERAMSVFAVASDTAASHPAPPPGCGRCGGEGACLRE